MASGRSATLQRIYEDRILPQLRAGSKDAVLRHCVLKWSEPDFQFSSLSPRIAEGLFYYLNQQAIPGVDGPAHPIDYEEIIETVDVYLSAMVTVIDRAGTKVDRPQEIQDEFHAILLKYLPKVLRWCLFFSKDASRLTIDHSFAGEQSIYRVVHKLTNIVVAAHIDYPPLLNLVSSSEDSAETLIHLWNVIDPDTGEPHFYDPPGLDGNAAIVDQLPLFMQRGQGEKTMIAVLERISPTTLKKMVKSLEYRIRSVRTSDPRSARKIYSKLERLMLILYSNLTFYYAVDRYVDWRCFTTILVQIFKDPNAFPHTSTMMEPLAIQQSPCAGLSHFVVWITATGSGLKRRLTQLFDSSDFATCKPGQRREANTLMHLLSLVFEWTARDERLSFMLKQELALLEPQSIYPQVAIAFYEAYLAIPERHRQAMESDPHCGDFWGAFVDTLRRRWGVYRQFAGNREIGDVVFVCDNPNHLRRMIEQESSNPGHAHDAGGSKACLCRYFVYCSEACQTQDWPRHRSECVDSGSMHDELKRDHRWITPSLRQQFTVYLSQFASDEVSATLLSHEKADRIYPGELEETIHYMQTNSLITNQDTSTRKWAKFIVAGMLDRVRRRHFPNSDLRDLVFTIKLDFHQDVALETTDAFRQTINRSRFIAGWTKKRVGRILDQCAELNSLRRNSEEFYVVLNVEAALGTDMIHFVCLAEGRVGSRPLALPSNVDVVGHHGELEFSVFHAFFFPSMAKSVLDRVHRQLNYAKENYI